MTSVPPIGHQIGKYHVLGVLGEGAMAWVLSTHEAGLERSVALKVLKPEFNSDTEVVGRFQDEARSAAQLRHRNIVAIFESGQANGWNYIAMDLVKGKSLRQLLDERKPLSEDRVIAILRQTATALDWAHDQRPTPYIHRDIKPENIMIGPGDEVTLVDFGLVRIGTASRRTRQGTVMGTFAYMSPEQIRGDLDISPATDVWSLGVVAFELLTGITPFHADNQHNSAIMHKVVNEPAPSVQRFNSSLGPSVDRVLGKALAKQPTQRWSSGRAFVSALETALHEARANTGVDGGMDWLRRRITLSPDMAWSLTGVAAAALVIWLLINQGNRSTVVNPMAVPTGTPENTTLVLKETVLPTIASTVTVADSAGTDTPPPVRTATVTPISLPTDAVKPTSTSTPVVRPTRVPSTAVPSPVTEFVNFWQDGPQLNAETSCTSIRWESAGFDHVFVWSEQDDAIHGPPKPASGFETNICGISPGDQATFRLAAVRADGTDVRRLLVVKRDDDSD